MTASKIPDTTTPAEAERLMKAHLIDNFCVVGGVAHIKRASAAPGDTNWPAESPSPKK